MKIYSLETLERFLTEDITWRIKEISDLKHSIEQASALLRYAGCRAGIPILYAHWEGHVKNSARAYVSFVASKRLQLTKLKTGYSLAALKGPIDRLVAGRGNRITQMDFLAEMDGLADTRFAGNADALSDTRSNLSFAVLNEISTVLGLDVAPFADSAVFIDKMLLERRNFIAHGHDVEPSINFDMLSDTADQTIGIMREFSNRVLYAALTEVFKR